MPSMVDFRRKSLSACGIAFAMAAAFASVPAQSAEKVLHTFTGGSDGLIPVAGVIADAAGNLYGTTAGGGGGTFCYDGDEGCGVVYAVAPDGTETVLHAFAGGCDGAFPLAALVADKAGNFYGTTQSGGVCNSDHGFGTVFKIAPDGTESVLYAFPGGSGGEYPQGALIADRKGNLFGVAVGGDPNVCNGGCGFVFELTPKGKMRTIYAFQGGNDGDGPEGALLMDKAGNIYGTTGYGGGNGCDGGYGCGTVFRIAPDGTETVLYAFQGGNDGWLPQNGVIADTAGNLYGTTNLGGGANNDGTVSKVTPAGAESVLYAFQDGAGGSSPEAGLIMDKTGNLYGTTYYGGSTRCQGSGCGTVFKLAPDGTETVLYAFATPPRPKGAYPAAGLLLGRRGGALYGTASQGGNDNDGVVFEVKTK